MTENDLRSIMTKRQIEVQRHNLVQVCRFTVKTLIDKASLTNIDDDSEELINFCAALEQVLSYRLKVQKTWYGSDEPRRFWHFIQQACIRVPNNCVQSITNLENVRSPTAKGRAWIRCVLMEKRLSEYLSFALQQSKLIKQSYLDGSVMLSDDAAMLCGVLLGLNAIDFSFCLKGESMEFPSPVAINFVPYLRYRQSSESVHSDQKELNELNNQTTKADHCSAEENNEDTWSEKFRMLETKYKTVTEQKGYLEELVRMRENQVQEVHRQRVTMLNTLKQFEKDSKQERQQLESVVLELQHQLSAVKKQKEYFEQKYQALISKFQDGQVAMEEIDSVKQETPHRHATCSDTLSDQMSFSSSEGFVNISVSAPKLSSRTSKQPTNQLRQLDSQSMVAMAGSFTSQVSDQGTTSSTNQNLQSDLPANENATNTSAAVIDVSTYQIVDHVNNSVVMLDQGDPDSSESQKQNKSDYQGNNKVTNENIQNSRTSDENQESESTSFSVDQEVTSQEVTSQQPPSVLDLETSTPGHEANAEQNTVSEGNSNNSFTEFSDEQIDESKTENMKEEKDDYLK